MRQNDVGEPPVTVCGQLRSCDSVGKVTPIRRHNAAHSLLRGGMASAARAISTAKQIPSLIT